MQPSPALINHLPVCTAMGAIMVAITSAYWLSRRKVKAAPQRRRNSSVA